MIDRPITLATAGLIIAREHGNPFQQRGLSGAVFADDDGEGPIETELEIVPQQGKAERIGLAVLNARWLEPDPPEIRRRHLDDAVSLRTHARAAGEPRGFPIQYGHFGKVKNKKGTLS